MLNDVIIETSYLEIILNGVKYTNSAAMLEQSLYQVVNYLVWINDRFLFTYLIFDVPLYRFSCCISFIFLPCNIHYLSCALFRSRIKKVIFKVFFSPSMKQGHLCMLLSTQIELKIKNGSEFWLKIFTPTFDLYNLLQLSRLEKSLRHFCNPVHWLKINKW